MIENIRDNKKQKLILELEGQLKDHKGVLEKCQSERDMLIKEHSEMGEKEHFPVIPTDNNLNPLNDYEDKIKLHELYGSIKDNYKFGCYKILEKEIKEKERVRRFMIETESEIQVDIDALDPITLRKIEKYVKECFTKDNIPFNETKSLDNKVSELVTNGIHHTHKNGSPGGKSSPSLEGQQNDEKTKSDVNQFMLNEDNMLIEKEESSSTSSSNDSTDSSDSESSEEVEPTKLVIESKSNRKMINNSL